MFVILTGMFLVLWYEIQYEDWGEYADIEYEKCNIGCHLINYS